MRCGAVVWRAVACCAVLCCAVLCCAVLCCAVLCCAVLCCAVLCCTVLYCIAVCIAFASLFLNNIYLSITSYSHNQLLSPYLPSIISYYLYQPCAHLLPLRIFMFIFIFSFCSLLTFFLSPSFSHSFFSSFLHIICQAIKMTEHFGFPIMISSADFAVWMSVRPTQAQGG